MGWDYINAPLDRTPDAYLRELFTLQRPGYTQTVERTAWAGSTCYVAVRCVSASESSGNGQPDRHCPYDDPRDHVAALVVLTSGNGRKAGFGYKVMDETMGPAEAHAPLEFLDALSPIRSGPQFEWARRWRERCRAIAERRVA